MNILNNIFNGKNENFYKAKTKLSNAKKRFNGFVIDFPDVTSDEIMFIKDHWEKLPNNLGTGVKIMALNFNSEVKLLLTSYAPNSYISPHKHLEEYEVSEILKGSLTNKLTGDKYKVGDKYKFEPNEVHYLQSSKDGCLVHSALTTNKTYNSHHLSKKDKKMLISA